MTNQIEKEFFETNGVEKIRLYNSAGLFYLGYPPITPEIILKLEEIITKWIKSTWNTPLGGTFLILGINLYQIWNGCRTCLYDSYADNRKDALLKLCTKLAPEIKEEVQKLFKGE